MHKSLFTTLIVVVTVAAFGVMVHNDTTAVGSGGSSQAVPFLSPTPADTTVAQAGSPLAVTTSEPIETSLENDLGPDRSEGEDTWQHWFVTDENSAWAAEEKAFLQQVLLTTFEALAQVGLDGPTLLHGYRFRRYPADYVLDKPGRIGLVDHEKQEISLGDFAFVRLWGFYIYHELGHAIDVRLGRELSTYFHRLAGSDQAEGSEGGVTAEGYYLRAQGRDDREEATADAFALWIMAENGMKRPVFFGTPVIAQHDDVTAAFAQALISAGTQS